MVSIIILCYNQLSYTKQCLESLFANTSQIRSEFEVIVVNNGSTDGTREYLKPYEDDGRIRAIHNDYNAGFPKANNQAAAIAKGEYLCLLNNDTILTEGWLEKLLRCMRSDHVIAAVGPWTNHSSGHQRTDPAPNYRGPAELKSFSARFSDEEKYVDFLVFFCVLIRQDVWDEIGGLDEDFTPGNYEDNLFCYRLLEKNYRMKVAGDCYVHHYAGQTFQTKDPKKLREYASLMARNQKLFFKKTGQYRSISLCMIVSDSENPETLKRCLDSAAEWIDEICIVFNYQRWPQWKCSRNPYMPIFPERFTEVLKGLPIATQYVKWTDFSDMRNRSIKMATGEYILWMDTDDILKTPAGMRDLLFKNPTLDAFKFQVHSYTERNTTETILHTRLFRRVKQGKTPVFKNRCHEDISYSMNELGYTHATTDMIVEHWGNICSKDWQRKNQRNLKLLEADIQEAGPEDKPRLAMLYYGVVNCYIIKASQEGPKRKEKTLVQALNTCDKCITLLENEDPLMAKMWMMRGLVCMDADQHLAAKQSFHKAYDEWKQPEAAVNLAEIYLREKNFDKVVEILKPLENAEGAYPIKNMSYDPVQLHSLLLEKLGHAWANKAQTSKDNFDEYIRKAESYYRKSLDFRPSVVISDLMLQILFNTKRFDEAGYLAIKAVNTWPRFWKAWWYLSQYEMLNNRKATAKLFLQECLRLNPKVKEARHNLEMLDKTRR